MNYTEFCKIAQLDDASLYLGATGAVTGGAGAYVLAKLLKAKHAWAYGLGGAAAGGTMGAVAGIAARDLNSSIGNSIGRMWEGTANQIHSMGYDMRNQNRLNLSRLEGLEAANQNRMMAIERDFNRVMRNSDDQFDRIMRSTYQLERQAESNRRLNEKKLDTLRQEVRKGGNR